MEISMDVINGVGLGIEYVPEEDDFDRTIIVDLILLRFLIQW